MNAIKRTTSLLLVTILLLTSTIFTTYGADKKSTFENSTTNINATDAFDTAEDMTPILDEVCGRVHSQETNLNTHVIQNGDGTFTKKVYSYPVKYIDQNGLVKDITMDIEQQSNGSFRTANNSIVTTFSKRLEAGIVLSHEDVTIKLVPATNNFQRAELTTTEMSLATLSPDKKNVSYPYGEQTKLEYSLTYTGFKEDIVVSQYTGQTEYSFLLYTNGFLLQQINGVYYIVDEQGTIKATLGEIIIFTADNRNNTMGDMTVETIKSSQVYALTIHIDPAYLVDEKTTYPIRIDPSIEISYANNGNGAIEDATITTEGGSTGTLGSLYIGKREGYGISRALMKFPGLDLSDIPDVDKVLSAKLTLRDLMCEGTAMDLSAHIFTGNSWTETSLSWAGVNGNSYVTTPLSTVTMSWGNGVAQEVDHYYEFDITEAVRAWVTGTYSKDKGILLKLSSSVENGNTYMHRTLASYNRAEHKPVLEVIYQPKISLNIISTTISEGSTRTLTAKTYPENATVTWLSYNPSVVTVSNGVLTANNAGETTISVSMTDAQGTYFASCTVYVRIPNGVYIIRNKYSNCVLDVAWNSVAAFSDVIQCQYGGTAFLNQMWKISYTSKGKYVIRPLHCVSMMLYANNNGTAEGYHSYDSLSLAWNEIPESCLWKITRYNSGIQVYSSKITSGTLSIGSQTTENVEIKLENNSETSYKRWDFQQVTQSISGARLYDLRTGAFYGADSDGVIRYIAPQEIRTMGDDLQLFASAYTTEASNPSYFNWQSSDLNIATVNSSTGEITGIAPGTVTIYSQKYNIQYTLIVTEIQNGVYYLANKETSKCVDIQSQQMANGTTIHQWNFHGGNTQKWRIEHIEDGYYRIFSCNTSQVPFYYLTVQNNSTANGAKVVLSDTVTNGGMWRISSTESKAYTLMAKTGEANNRVLAVQSTSGDINANGLDMEQKPYYEDKSYLDEWRILLPENYGGELTCWYSDSHKIGYWETSPKIYREKLDNNSSFIFEEATTNAMNQWNDALDFSMTFVDTIEEAGIVYYGGAVQTIKDELIYKNLWDENHIEEFIVDDYTRGITIRVGKKSDICEATEYYSYNGQIKYIEIMEKQQCNIFYPVDSSAEEMIHTGIHEMGHGVGFLGHSINTGCIMTQGGGSNTVLTNQDKLHLQQLYN